MKRIVKITAISLILLVGLAMILDHLYPPNLHRAQQISTLVLDAEGRLLRGFTTAEGSWRLPPETVDPLYLKLLKAYEDRRFHWHPGVDPLAVVRALGQWLSHGRVVSGASTLSMQTARLLEPRPRNLASKLLEMLRALQLEWHYDKAKILELYLTLAPYGANLEGLRSATLAYLGKEPAYLTPAEAALLVVLPQAPSRLRPDRYPERARSARDKVLTRMQELGVLSAQQVAEARQEDIPQQRHPLPFHAPHLARRLRSAEPQRLVHNTFIEGNLQQTLEALARRAQDRLGPQAGLALLVVENRERRVLAYLGSADFFAHRRAGQVDMVQAVRSPGSTLKPLIYGLGFDDLIIHPETLVNDVPTRFGDYSPSNFLNTYRGQVSVREALQRSLNIPAVAVLEQVGPTRVDLRLREAGIPLSWSGPYQRPGLPLVLGGVGTTLAHLVTLYAGLADAGQVIPLRLGPDDPLASGKQLLSPVASWYLSRILEQAPPPEAVVSAANSWRPRHIAYKTGTSYGFRDAWALGYDQDYTVGVWVGRPDGSPSPGHYGRNTAAPLLFQVFDLLPEPDPRPPTTAPAGVLVAGHNDLPERLKHLHRGRRFKTDPLRITFPVDGSTVELAFSAGRMDNLPLVAKGGQRPLYWLVNGMPIPAKRRKGFWRPDGEGMVRVTVIDTLGQSAQARVWVVKNGAGG